ncbi:HutD family protein [Pectobacterium polaris]|uniref:HutD/Ves family protein n=1 Tax=Pectobacterium polaris TaxID=2042057 RepID=UPI002404F98D|nr:HutD family protein [Pectobacterium polaris]MDG0802513.1 HutD family protein [Pectobacterium polaris]
MTTLLPYINYLEMRWKNGLGVTQEVYRYPATEQYDWRVSVATIRDAGPFSRFTGYQRNISVLEGEGMFLTIDGERSVLIPAFQPTDFNGDSDVFCDVVGGPLLDFNVIYDAKTTQASVHWVNSGEWSLKQGPLLLFNAGHALEVNVDGERHFLHHYDSLLIDTPATVVVSAQPTQIFACVMIEPVTSGS